MIKSYIAVVILGLAITVGSLPGYLGAQMPTAARSIDPSQTVVPAAAVLTKKQEERLPLDVQCQRDYASAPADIAAIGCKWGFLHLYTSEQADQYFGKFSVGNAIGLSLGDDQASLYTELLSDNIFLNPFFGYARVGFATQVSAADDSASATTADQFFQGGGNAVLYAAIPMRVRMTYAGDRTQLNPIRRFDSVLSFAIGADVPELSTPSTDPAAYARVGAQTEFTWRAHNEDFRFFVLGNGGYVLGLNQSFYENLTGDESVDGPAWGMLAGTATVGVDLAKLFRVGVRFGHSTLESVTQKPRLTVQVLPKR